MRKILWAIGLAGALVLPAAAEEDGDGLFALGDATAARKATAADGRVIGLGDRLTHEVQEARLTSRDNANREYALQLKFPFIEDLGRTRTVLVVKGTAHLQSSSGSEADKSSSLGFQVSGRENAEAVAAHFGIKPKFRVHPGHRLSVSFVPAEEEFGVEGAKTITLRIENVGETAVYFQVGGRNRAARDNQFVFRATDGDKPLPDIGSDQHMGGISTIRELKPGEVFEHPVDLALWFSFEKPGTFFVHGSYHLDFFESRKYTEPLWEDWATAEFRVRIRPEEK
ncbi:MAG: hypothetical protein HYY18_08415 [Planctomycetes bacterium]|nr:hypothetical protein [Planctomycetota bacterium]